MSEYLQENWKFLIAALLVHAVIAAALTVQIASRPVRVTPQLAIQATVVSESALRRVDQRKQQEAQRQRDQQERAAQQERDRQAAEQRREQEAEAEKAAVVQRQEQQREAEQQKQAEAQRQAEADATRQAAEKTRQVQADKEKKAAADKQRAAEIEKRQREVADQRRAADALKAQSAREAELKQQLAEEAGRMQAENAGLNNQYAALIEQRVYRNWNRPATARPGIECQVRVTQAPAGTVLSVEVGQCNGDAAVRQSIEAAVLRSSPLPPPPDPRLFQRNVLLIFKPLD